MSKSSKNPETQTTTSTRRALPRNASTVLSSLEENVIRMRHGIGEAGPGPLGTKASSPALAEMLYAIEARAYEMTGRAAAARSKRPSPKAKIIEALKTRS